MSQKVKIKKHAEDCPVRDYVSIEYVEHKAAGEDCPFCEMIVVEMERDEAIEHFRKQLGLKTEGAGEK